MGLYKYLESLAVVAIDAKDDAASVTAIDAKNADTPCLTLCTGAVAVCWAVGLSDYGGR